MQPYIHFVVIFQKETQRTETQCKRLTVGGFRASGNTHSHYKKNTSRILDTTSSYHSTRTASSVGKEKSLRILAFFLMCCQNTEASTLAWSVLVMLAETPFFKKKLENKNKPLSTGKNTI